MYRPLLFEYAQDWRHHSLVFRLGGGARHLVSRGMAHRARQWAFAFVLLGVAVVSLRHQLWAILALALVTLAWRVPHLVALKGLERRAAFGLRPAFRSHPVRQIRLGVTEAGLREIVAGAETFAPWSNVRAYFVYRSLVGIELANNQAAYIPGSMLSQASARVADLIAALETRGVARREPGPVVARHAV